MEFFSKMEQCGRWPQQACTTMFFSIPLNVTSEGPIALLPTMIRWWRRFARARSNELATGGTPPTVEMEELSVRCARLGRRWERFDHRAGEKDRGAIAMVLDVAEAFERVSLPVVWAWAARSVLRMCGGAVPDHHGHLLWVDMELLASPYCVSRRFYPPKKKQGFCG